jgi:hypothetical protein
MKKIFTVAILLAVLGIGLMINPTESKNKAYYSGETVSYKGKIYIGTVNTGKFELLALENNKIVKKTAITSPAAENKNFIDLLFSKENGNLYVYLVNGRFIYKYNISEPTIPTLAMKIKDNSADWTAGINKENGQLVTVTNRGLRVWNDKYQIINSYKEINDKNIGTASFFSDNIAIASKNKISVYNTASRKEVSQYTIAVNDERTNRDMTIDSDSNLIYVVDDKSLKAINSDGQVIREFKHISDSGYDVATSVVNPNYLYFTDGIGIVKVDKETMKPVDWTWTIRTAPQGSWAMGLRTVGDSSGEKIVIFNGSNIMVLDQNFKTVAFYVATEKETNPVEGMTIGLDKDRAAIGSQVSIHGTGFGPGEDLKIEMNKILVATVTADDNGRFEAVFTIPSMASPLFTDIKVTGKSSGRTYSTSFQVE